MNKKHITITAIAAILVLSMAALSIAGPGYGRGYGRGGCGGPGYGANGAYSQLTPEKQVAVNKIYEKYQVKFAELRDQMWAKHATLQAMINGGNADEKKIAALTSEVSNLRQQMWDMRDAMGAELEKETGIVAGNGYAACPAYGQANCPGGGGYGNRGFGHRGPGGGRGMY